MDCSANYRNGQVLEWDSRLQQGLCPLDRAVTSSIVSQSLTEHRSCFLTPGGGKYSEATFSGSTLGLENLPCPSLDNHDTKWFCLLLSPSLFPVSLCCCPVCQDAALGTQHCWCRLLLLPHYSGFWSTELRDHAINLSLSTCTRAYTSVLFTRKLFLLVQLFRM